MSGRMAQSNLRDQLAQILTKSADRMGQDFARVMHEDPEGLHDYRVALRTLRSNLRTFEPLLRRRWVKQFRADLAEIDAAFGVARDADVMLESLDALAEAIGLAIPAEVRAAFVARRTEARGQLAQEIESDWFLRQSAHILPRTRRPVARSRFRELRRRQAHRKLLKCIARTKADLLVALERTASSESAEQLHMVRIAAKRCRYAHELELSDSHAAVATAAKQLQTLLGEFQDLSVLRLQLVVGGHSDEVPVLLADITANQQRLREAYTSLRQQLLTEWARD